MHGRLKAILSALALMAGASLAAAQDAGLGAAGELVDPELLRVCADPSSMPLSDKNGQGFENKLAELVAKKLGRKSVSYVWYPQVQGFVRNTLSSNLCDVIMGYPQGDALVQNTNAYYTSAYVLIYKSGGPLDGVATIADPKLQGKKVGIVEGTPPSRALVAAKLMRTAKVYPLMFDTRLVPSQSDVMIKDLADGKIDAALLWGPTAGLYAKEAAVPLTVVPLLKEQGRMAFRITMGVRPSDQQWKRQLNTLIKENQSEINALLLGYGVPLLDDNGQQIKQ